MSVKLFTTGEISELKMNPYVVEVTERFIYFSEKFKQRFYDEKKSGKKIRAILTDMQINPDILGMKRVYGIRRHIFEEAERGLGFSDLSNSQYRDKPVNIPPEEKIERLEHELAYTKQELDFVKKIIAANREAARS